MLTLLTNIDLLVVGSVFELNEACDNGGAFLIDEVYTGKVKVGWINNNELLFGNTDNDGCDGVLVKRSYGDTSSTCASVGDNLSV